MKKFSEFRKTQKWKDLRFPLVWLPILSICILPISYHFTGRMYGLDFDLISLLAFALVSVVISSVSYLTIPFIIRFLILRRPLKRGASSSYVYTVILSVIAKAILTTTGITASKTGTIPFLQMVAVYFVLVAGYEDKPVIQWDVEDSRKE